MSAPDWSGVVEMVRRTYTARGRRQTALFSIEGLRLAERAVRANAPVAQWVVSADFAHDTTPRIVALRAAITATPVTAVPPPVMAQLTNGRTLGSIIGLLPLPQPHPLATLLAHKIRPLLLVAADIVEPGNVGAMLRTAHAHQADLFIATGRSDPFHPKAVRNSMGSLFKMPIYQAADTAVLLAELAQLGIETVGTSGSATIRLPDRVWGSGGTAVFMGNEYEGLSADLLGQLDQQIAIPMAPGIDSLSVNAATAVVLYEYRRGEEICVMRDA